MTKIVDFPELLSCLCFTKRGLPFVFAPKNPHHRLPEILHWYASVGDERAGGRSVWVVYHIFVPMVLRCARLARESSAKIVELLRRLSTRATTSMRQIMPTLSTLPVLATRTHKRISHQTQQKYLDLIVWLDFFYG